MKFNKYLIFWIRKKQLYLGKILFINNIIKKLTIISYNNFKVLILNKTVNYEWNSSEIRKQGTNDRPKDYIIDCLRKNQKGGQFPTKLKKLKHTTKNTPALWQNTTGKQQSSNYKKKSVIKMIN